MSSYRVIQDSDESDDELATLATPVIQPQAPSRSTDPLAAKQDGNPSSYVSGAVASGMDVQGTARPGPDLTVNFHEFLVSTGQMAPDSRSQPDHEARLISIEGDEQLDVLGGDHVVAHGNDVLSFAQHGEIISKEINLSSSKGGLKRGRTIGILDEINHASDSSTKKLKRRKTMINESDHTSFKGDDPRYPPEFENLTRKADYCPNTTLVSSDLDCTFTSNYEVHQSDIRDEPIHGPAYEAAIAENGKRNDMELLGTSKQSRRINLCRPMSMLMPTDSPHDTEPMSSTSFARARRSMTNHGELLPESPTQSADELASPAPVQIAVNKPSARSDRAGFQMNDNTLSKPDELGSDDFGGMPKEMYKPRPSRSRAKNVEAADDFAAHHIDDETTASSYDKLPSKLPHEPSDEIEKPPEEVPQQVEQKTSGDDMPKIATADKLTTQTVQFAVQPANTSPHLGPSKRERKASRKRKLKRGKTTSVIIEKIADSDVEDDVIWVDESPGTLLESEKCPDPSTMAAIDKNQTKIEDAIPKEEPVIGIQIDPETTSPTNHAGSNCNEGPISAPKKRGRKPKKKLDAIAIEIPNQSSNTANSSEFHTKGAVRNDLPVPDPLTELNEIAPPQPQAQPTLSEPHDEPIDVEDMNIIPKGQTHHPNPPSTPRNTEKENQKPSPDEAPPSSTPKKAAEKGPDKHSPITVNKKVSYRVGLSRKAKIAPLLKIIRK
ncbi:hypothetical protein PRK78_002349 [Emydomyces testavorans]|uniref:Uncharacterized protein n=1 Tax=Emydomyces testavorans TaxID=2070801 RepID=A0AAF0IHI2_9EURO|nr:hypothetical protein PRK78_002349 [Emydomyces testavorans]